MRRWWNLGAALTLALAVTACAGDRTPDADTDRSPGDATVGTSGETEGNVAEERQFVEEQIAMGQKEIELGQLAQQRGSHPEVKRFGEMMVREHRAAGEELKRLSTNLASAAATNRETAANRDTAATRDTTANREATGTSGTRADDRRYDAAGTSGTTDLREEHREAVEELKQASGAEFDKKYIDQMVDDHEKAVNDVERRAENANNPEVRQWAAKALPKMQQHLERAKMIQETLENRGNTRRQ